MGFFGGNKGHKQPEKGNSRLCPNCGGSGSVGSSKLRVGPDGRAETEHVSRPCGRCDGVGWERR